MNKDILSLGNKYKKDISESLGYDNVTFYKGKIQNLKLNMKEIDNYIIENKINNSYDYDNLTEHIRDIEQNNPMIKDNSIDVVISNCVLNLVSVNEKEQLF